ncbi:MAG: DUF2269 family protein, partial [Microbacterium sp.]|nr:DUF2269 family protein [Microbacterium sp.]
MGMAPAKYHLSFTTPWILWSIILYVIAFVLSVFVAVPQMNKAADRLDQAPEGGAAAAGYGGIAASNGIAALLLVAVVVLMVWKP